MTEGVDVTRARVVAQYLGAVRDRLHRDERGADLVQVAIGVVIAVIMGTLLLTALNTTWPEIIKAALDRVQRLVSG
jgi:hypothetical protein